MIFIVEMLIFARCFFLQNLLYSNLYFMIISRLSNSLDPDLDIHVYAMDYPRFIVSSQKE